jgi:Aldo/keto reductase family
VFRPVDESEGIRAVHVALDMGINYFDVAPAYGGTVAETVLGKALRGIPRDRYYLSTKAGKFTDPDHYGSDELNYSRARILESVAASMRRLGVVFFESPPRRSDQQAGYPVREPAPADPHDALQLGQPRVGPAQRPVARGTV